MFEHKVNYQYIMHALGRRQNVKQQENKIQSLKELFNNTHKIHLSGGVYSMLHKTKILYSSNNSIGSGFQWCPSPASTSTWFSAMSMTSF